MWELDCKEGWAPKNWCRWTVGLEKALESPLDCKEIQPVHFEGDQPWDFFGRNDAKAETPVLWPPHVKSQLIEKDSDAGRDWVQEEKGTTEDEMAGWHHWLDGRESEWTPGLGDGQGGLACCDSWGCKESDTTEQLNWTECSWLLRWYIPLAQIKEFSLLLLIPLEKAMAPHSSTLAWEIPWMEAPGRLQFMGSLGSDTTERLHFHFSLSWIGEGNGNPLQCSCLENPSDGGAWWAAVYGVAQSRTRLKWLSSSSS